MQKLSGGVLHENLRTFGVMRKVKVRRVLGHMAFVENHVVDVALMAWLDHRFETYKIEGILSQLLEFQEPEQKLCIVNGTQLRGGMMKKSWNMLIY